MTKLGGKGGGTDGGKGGAWDMLNILQNLAGVQGPPPGRGPDSVECSAYLPPPFPPSFPQPFPRSFVILLYGALLGLQRNTKKRMGRAREACPRLREERV